MPSDAARDPPLLTPDWAAPPGVGAAMSTRSGGVSSGPYRSANLGTAVGDDPAAVAENRRRFAVAIGARPVWLQQVHGAQVLRVGAADADAPPLPADAAWTDEPGVACTVQVADCLPVLLATRDGSVIGAAHAGWRGLSAGVLEATLDAMRCDPRTILAWLGPAIGPASFEVGEEVRSAFLAGWPEAQAAFRPNDRKRWLCDLYLLARQRLAARGITDVHGGGWCTLRDAQRFFSFRRDGRTGRMAALLWKEQIA